MVFMQGTARLFNVLRLDVLRSHPKCMTFPKYLFRCLSNKRELKVYNIDVKDYIAKLQSEYLELLKVDSYMSNPRCIELQPVINIITKRDELITNIVDLKELAASPDKDLAALAKEEETELETKLYHLEETLIDALLPEDREDSFDTIILEVQAGVGGQEAMLFAQEMFDMYCSFISLKGWKYDIVDYMGTDLGGIRRGSILVNGSKAYKFFKHEGGVHRVQRIPSTEKSSRIHTSTVSVTALPQPNEIDIRIDPKDLKIETKRSTGAGGQHVNTTDSAVRIVHLPTNIMVECQVDRSQIKNRKLALTKLRALLYQRELEEQLAQQESTKKSQVSSNNRNEKIRTYNFNQDRITDHRLSGVHFHNIKMFMETGADLEELNEQLDRQARISSLLEIVNKFSK
uniref:Prokaryotic-type class I peptide chain release factors domain-containing protein n=1 Tax=Dendroctonus ponderosae TaxID=77166 RepID=J3JXQ3_DENPD|nr:unknown [Dendroctonus ponderosae]